MMNSLSERNERGKIARGRATKLGVVVVGGQEKRDTQHLIIRSRFVGKGGVTLATGATRDQKITKRSHSASNTRTSLTEAKF